MSTKTTILIIGGMCLCWAAAQAEEAALVRQGTFTEITDSQTGGCTIEGFGMSDDGLKVVVYTVQQDLSTWAIRLLDADGTSEQILFTANWSTASGDVRHVWFGPAISDDGSVVVWSDVAWPSWTNYRLMKWTSGGGTQVLLETVSSSSWGDPPVARGLYPRSRQALSGNGQLVVFLNNFGPQGPNSDSIPESGYTYYAVNTSTGAATPVLESRDISAIPGISPSASELWEMAELNFDGTVMVCTPKGAFQDYPAKNVLMLNAAAGGNASVLLDTAGMEYRGGSLNGDGSVFVFSRYGTTAPEPHGLQMMATDGSWGPTLLAPDDKAGRWPTGPDVNSEGTAVSFQFDIGGGSNATIRYTHTDSYGVIPLFYDSMIAANKTAFNKPSFVSADGNRVAFVGLVRHSNDPRPDNLVIFDWAPPKASVTGLSGNPRVTMITQSGGATGRDTTKYEYATTGCDGFFRQEWYDEDGHHPKGIYDFESWPYDNGLYGDEVAGDGVYTDNWVWARAEDVTKDHFHARGIATSANRTASIADFYVEVRAPILSAAAFEADVVQGRAPLEVTFTNLSVGDFRTAKWDFEKDGVVDSMEMERVTHTYTESGVYSVSLTLEGVLAGNDTETRLNYVEVLPKEDIDGQSGVNAVDVQLVINAALEIDIGGLNADVNGDGDVNAVDVQRVINKALE